MSSDITDIAMRSERVSGGFSTVGSSPRTVPFTSLRRDWYEGGELMPKLIRRASPLGTGDVVLQDFPRHWLPLFELIRVKWMGSVEPPSFVPFVTGRSEAEILTDVHRARDAGLLRLAVEAVAGCDPLIAETLPAVDLLAQIPEGGLENMSRIRLCNWHSYGRPEIKLYERELTQHNQTCHAVVFLPCSRVRPYDRSPTYRKVQTALTKFGIDFGACDKIVVTSLGPVPKALWCHPTVLRYDTGVRDVYRMLILFRRMLADVHYDKAYDCLNVAAYRDLLNVLQLEGFLRTITRVEVGRSKSASSVQGAY